MANSYFRFKQFLIEQDKTAMKVTTDACLFGSLFSTMIPAHNQHAQVLDIGAGTGLLSLMYAQQFPFANIDAVEIDEHAFAQAAENINASPWANRINIINTNITSYEPGKKYDMIICNPPFYENDLKSPDAKRNKALHDSHLTISELFKAVDRLLKSNGKVLMLLPYHRADYCKTIGLQTGLFCDKAINVKQTPTHNYFRSIMTFSSTEKPIETSEIIIKVDDQYSEEFAALLSPFYLAL